MGIEIILADDHNIMREGLRLLLSKYPDIDIIGETDNGRDTINLAKKFQPDVVIMDVTMPELNGIDASLQIMSENKKIKVIALSMHSDKRFVEKMLRAGASGYLLKNCATRELIIAIREVIKGHIYLSPDISDMIVKDYLDNTKPEELIKDKKLTSREREIVQLIAEGFDTRTIATKIHLSPKTVETHRRRSMEKLGISNIASLIKYAIKEGLTELDIY